MRFDWKTPAGIVIVLAIATVFWLGISRYQQMPHERAFAHEGALIRDNPGFTTGEWYFSYEEAGSPGLAVRLEFDHESRCGNEDARSACDSSFDQGQRVYIEGMQSADIVRVQKLIYRDAPAETGMRIKLYYYDPARDQGQGGVQCTEKGLVSVERIIPQTQAPLAEAIRLLLRGEISPAEAEQGIETEFPLEGVSLTSETISDGVATLSFDDPLGKTGGGSCRVAILWHQIEATAKQFPTVRSVRFMPEELFQP